MKEPFLEKIKHYIRKLCFWHKYDCCNKLWKVCKLCVKSDFED